MTRHAAAARPAALPGRGVWAAPEASRATPADEAPVAGPAVTGEVILLHGDCAPFLTQQLTERWPPEAPHAAQLLRGLSAYRRRGAAALPDASGGARL